MSLIGTKATWASLQIQRFVRSSASERRPAKTAGLARRSPIARQSRGDPCRRRTAFRAPAQMVTARRAATPFRAGRRQFVTVTYWWVPRVVDKTQNAFSTPRHNCLPALWGRSRQPSRVTGRVGPSGGPVTGVDLYSSTAPRPLLLTLGEVVALGACRICSSRRASRGCGR
jgi:hypothetical protein